MIQKLKKVLSGYSSLLLLFQRSPLVQMLFPEANLLASSAAMNSSSFVIATVVGLGAYDSVAGATALAQEAPSRGSLIVPVTSGVALGALFQVTGSPSQPESWAVSVGTLPAGLTLANAPGSTTTLTGTTTEVGDKVVTVSAWEFPNFKGPVVSKQFTIRVSPAASVPAAISSSPVSTTINSGQTTTLTVTATGDAPLTYEWFQGASGTTTTPVGTNSASFTTPALTTTTSYWVKVTNPGNLTGAKSTTATVTVRQPAAIATHPASTTINSGQTTTLSVVASGFAPLSYQWYQGTSGVITTPVGTDSASFTTPVLTATTSYWVRVTNSLNPTGADSAAAVVTVRQPAAIVTQPASTTINSGETTTLSVVASGEAPLSYQWYQGTSGVTTTPVGTNSASFTSPVLFVTTSYWVKVTNSVNPTGANSDTAEVTATPPVTPVIVTASPLATGAAGTSYNVSLEAVGGTSPYTWTLSSGTLPAGLSLSSAGILSGTPTVAGTNTSNFTLQVEDSKTTTGTKAFSLSISDLRVVTTTLPTAVKSVPFIHQLNGSGGNAPHAWSVSTGTLPSGITLSSAGVLSGTPTSAGSSSFTLRLTDAASFSVSRQFTLPVSASFLPPVVDPVNFPVIPIGTTFGYTVSAQNYPKTFAISGLPKGMKSVPATGVISGIPEAAGVFNIQVRASNTAGSSPMLTTRLIIEPLNPNFVGTFGGLVTRDATANHGLGGALAVTTTSLGTYSIKLTTAAGSGNVTASTSFINTGRLAASAPHISVLIGGQTLALTFNATTGQITGTHGSATVSGVRSAWNALTRPAEKLQGYYSMALDLADLATDGGKSAIPQGSGFATFSVSSAGSVSVAGKAADGEVITSSSFLGAAGESWLYAPLYKSLGSMQGSFNLTQDPAGRFVDNRVSGSMSWFKPLTTARAYAASFGPVNLTADGGYLAPASTGSVVLGLPDPGNVQLNFTEGGLTNSLTNPKVNFTYTSDNKVTPPPVATNPGKVTIAINPATGAVSGDFTLVETTPPLTRAKVPFQGQVVRLGNGTVKAAGYFLLPQIPASGQTAATAPILSGGFRVLNGTPAPEPVPSAVKDTPFNQSLTGTGGTPPYIWTLSAGTLPAGITLGSDGVLSGTPTATGTFIFTVEITDANHVVVTKDYTLTVSATSVAAPVLQPVNFPVIPIGTIFGYTVSALNSPKTFAISGLPKGMKSVPATGVISGIPEAAGVFNIQVRASNTAGSSPMLTTRLIIEPLNPNFVGTFGGLVTRDATANHGLGGALAVTTTSLGTYSIKLTTAAGSGNVTASTSFINTGRLAASAPHISVLIGGQTLALTFNATTGQITGTHGSATVSGVRSAWNALTRPAEKLQGYYSMALDLADLATDGGKSAIPQGSGFATFSVSSAGSVSVAGKAADGEVITSSSFLGAAGESWLYAPLYKSLGSMQGSFNLTQDPAGRFVDNRVSGSMSWFKPLTTARAYAASFGPVNLTADGGYLAPASTGSVVLGLPDPGNVQLNFTEGGLTNSLTNPKVNFTYTSDNKVTPPPVATNPGKVTIAINPATGAVSGDFTLVETTPPLTRAKVPFQGQVVRLGNGTVKAAGYFLLPQIPASGQTAATAPILSGGFRVLQPPTP